MFSALSSMNIATRGGAGGAGGGGGGVIGCIGGRGGRGGFGAFIERGFGAVTVSDWVFRSRSISRLIFSPSFLP